MERAPDFGITCFRGMTAARVGNPGGDEDAVSLHAWVAVGVDTIIDGGLASRMAASGDWHISFDRDLLAPRAHDFVIQFDFR